MTPQEHIAHLRHYTEGDDFLHQSVLAVCDLAERALLSPEEAEAGVLKRLLGGEPSPVEHRLDYADAAGPFAWRVQCSCGRSFVAADAHEATVLWAAHAGIGED